MAFHKSKATNADPLLVDLDNGMATFSDGTKLNFPDGVKFTDRDLESLRTDKTGKVGVRVEMWGKDAAGVDVELFSFVLIQGATKATVENAIRRCTEGV